MLKVLVNVVGEDGYIFFENRMVCGIGVCYVCVCKKKKKDDYIRVCYDGLVYLVSDVEIE